MQLQIEVLFMMGILAICTWGLPGVQGAGITGMQGIGVNTPSAAAVALATWGLASDMHMAKGRMFTSGLLSLILASGTLEEVTLFTGNTMSEEGAVPKEHIRVAPIHT